MGGYVRILALRARARIRESESCATLPSTQKIEIFCPHQSLALFLSSQKVRGLGGCRRLKLDLAAFTRALIDPDLNVIQNSLYLFCATGELARTVRPSVNLMCF